MNTADSPQPGQRPNASLRHLGTPADVKVLQGLWELTADPVNAPVVNVDTAWHTETLQVLEVLWKWSATQALNNE